MNTTLNTYGFIIHSSSGASQFSADCPSLQYARGVAKKTLRQHLVYGWEWALVITPEGKKIKI